MTERPSPSRRAAAPGRAPWTVDVVAFSPRGRALGVLCPPVDGARGRRAFPYAAPRDGESLERCARRLVREATGEEPAWIEQLGAFADGKRHPGAHDLSVAFVAVMPTPEGAGRDGAWADLGDLAQLGPRQKAMGDAALAALRTRMDHAPIAFGLLRPQFTLTELQQAYELLLGRRLHKASFRRALQAAFLVVPTDEWRSEGRGRPAQFYEYAPRKRRAGRRGVRFDTLG